MKTIFERQDVIGRYITEIWQGVSFDHDGMDYCDNYICLDNGKQFLFHFSQDLKLEQCELPADAVRFNGDYVKPMFESPIANVLCPERPEAEADESFIVLASGLWISQVTSFPSGALAVGLFCGFDAPWSAQDRDCALLPYFK